MFYQEEIINGVLCWRGTPKGDWVEFTQEQLTKEIVRLKESRYTDK